MNILIRALWFIFIGWWLGLIAIWAGWLLNVLIITLPLGLFILNRLPQIMTLRPESQDWQVDGSGRIIAGEPQQINFIVRAIYFLLIGWWFSLVWLSLAYLALVVIILMPLAFWMFNRAPAVTTLRVT